MIVDTEEILSLGEPVGWNTKVQMYHATQDTLSDLLSAIQNHFPDKIVLLDIWGTWCGPCVNDIKKSKAKIEELKTNNIEVVYLCEGNGSKMATWQGKVLDYDMKGLQFFLSPNLTNQFLSRFEITGYPSHVIMNADGNFHLDDNHFIENLKVVDILKM
jgi:thiol-disulfide isomerase/thioredoxin